MADAIYDAAVEVLRERTRDHKSFPLVFEELCNYGFRRNLWGLRRLGVGLALVSLLSAIVLLLPATRPPFAVLRPPLVPVAGIDILVVGLWLWFVRPAWVQQAADAYAQRLIASTERLI